MFRKNYLKLIYLLSLLMISGTLAAAQTAPISGKVELKKADGTTEPVNGATVDVFRTDIKGSLPSAKTNKKGEFSFAGIPVGATVILSVSAPGAAPGFLTNIKAGQDRLLLTLSEGDGKRWTEAEMRQALSQAVPAGAGGELSEDQKKAQAEYNKKVAEVAAKNKDIENKNAVVTKALQDGNTAFNAKDYDTAVAKYSEGINADPDFAGSAPILLNNKGAALRQRAVNTYNTSIKLPQAERQTGLAKVREDLAEAADSYNKSFTILKAAQAGDIDAQVAQAAKLAALTGAKDTFRLMAKTEQVDGSKTEVAKTLIPEYIAVETEAPKKAEAQTTLGDVYRVAGDFDNAIAAYRKSIELSPNDPDALAGLGLSLFAAGEAGSNTEQKQEGLNYMVKFTEVAPANHTLKDDVASVVTYLKSQKLTPQKVTTKKKN